MPPTLPIVEMPLKSALAPLLIVAVLNVELARSENVPLVTLSVPLPVTGTANVDRPVPVDFCSVPLFAQVRCRRRSSR